VLARKRHPQHGSPRRRWPPRCHRAWSSWPTPRAIRRAVRRPSESVVPALVVRASRSRR